MLKQSKIVRFIWRILIENITIFLLVLNVGKEGMIHFIVIHDNPSNLQQPIHSLRETHQSVCENPFPPKDIDKRLQIANWTPASGHGWQGWDSLERQRMKFPRDVWCPLFQNDKMMMFSKWWNFKWWDWHYFCIFFSFFQICHGERSWNIRQFSSSQPCRKRARIVLPNSQRPGLRRGSAPLTSLRAQDASHSASQMAGSSTRNRSSCVSSVGKSQTLRSVQTLWLTSMVNWLVVWLPFLKFSHILGF